MDDVQQQNGQDLHELELQRRANRDKAQELGFEPYGLRTDGLITLAHAHAAYDADADNAHQEAGREPPEDFVDQRPIVNTAGRIVLHRDNGKLIWLKLRDASGDLQVAVSKRDCPEQSFEYAKRSADLGDIVTVTGRVMKTRTGEVTVWADHVAPATKCLIPPPEKHAGLQDIELRYRKRYLDLWATPETMRTFILRSKLVARVRSFLDDRGYIEVDTPVLQTQAGGAAARPFFTHMNALDMPLSLRIAPELFLKRLLVGGMPAVYEVSRNFRNEGLDKSHNPEFTSLEVYQAFGDYRTMLELTESLIRELAQLAKTEQNVEGDGLVLPFGDLSIDYGAPFAQTTYATLFESALGFPMTDTDKARAEAQRRGMEVAGKDDILVVNELFEEVAEAALDPAKPTFVLDYPAALSPLTRACPDDPSLAARWDLFIGGMEIGPAYTELNDPDVQAERFREQLSGIDDEESTFRTFDEDFIEALRVGMPPAGGLGLGIDRLVMLMANERSIRDVILFPMMRPLTAE